MNRKLWLSILCAILSQGIFAQSEEIEESTIFKIRKKRLIDRSPHGNKPVKIQDVPYIVNIQRDGVNQCGGSILSTTIVITAAHCFFKKNSTYSIISGASNLRHGKGRKVVKKIINPNFHPPAFPNDLALLVISPPFDLVNSVNRNITLHNGTLAPNASGIFSGWGCTELTETKIEFPGELRSIKVPILSHDVCRRAYPNNIISKKEICTFDTRGQKSSCNGDSGGPFVVDGKLLGVMSWGGISGNGEDPDIFVNLAFFEYTRWISSYLHH